MAKQLRNFRVVSNQRLGNGRYALLELRTADGKPMPSDILPGQFVQIAVDTPGVLLRRPISINNCNETTLWLLVRDAGRATHRLVNAVEGEIFNILLPLGNGFTLLSDPRRRVLLAGGGVGVAPLLMLGLELQKRGFWPHFLLGARSAADHLELDLFEEIGELHLSTDDGSLGSKGTVVDNPVLREMKFDRIYCCGPKPMMVAIAREARRLGTECEVSLENMMACGLGACLCCVEKTVRGNVCVCTQGPVFNINDLTWQISE